MLYWFLDWLEQTFQPTGFQVFEFITVRAALAAGTALLVGLVAGRRIIRYIAQRQYGETVREGADAGVVSHKHKAGTPSMGGVIILLSLFSGTLLWAELSNVYVQLALLSTAWMGAFGFADDYIKIIQKNKGGLRERTKLIGQVTFGIAFGVILYIHPQFYETRTMSTLPFVKEGFIDYADLVVWLGGMEAWAWALYIPLVVFIITAVSNAVNLTDGLDGLAAGVSAFVAAALLVLCYISGNATFADYLNVLFLPGSGELTVFAAALVAACIGFLWYNAYPAQVFMGDTGSLALGGAFGALALMTKKELLLPVLCGVFFIETLSVLLQRYYFKYTRLRYGEGRRIFRMAPLHHHYEALGIPESKIVIRFWIVTALLVIVTLVTLRIR